MLYQLGGKARKPSTTLLIMIRYSILFLVIAIIAVLISFSENIISGFATSVVPGWHTTIYPPFYVVSILQLAWICLLPLLYHIVEKRGKNMGHRAFLFHVFATLAFFVPSIDYVDFFGVDESTIMVLLPLVLFIIGQCWFLVAALKAWKS